MDLEACKGPLFILSLQRSLICWTSYVQTHAEQSWLRNEVTTFAVHCVIPKPAHCDILSAAPMWTLDSLMNTFLLVPSQINQKILGQTSEMSILAEVADLVNQSGKRVVHMTRLHRSSAGWTLGVVEFDHT